LWADEPVSPDEDAANTLKWHGKVQRVVDGESHAFKDWPDMVGVLVNMLSGPSDDVARTPEG
jgi:hypothetical protein